MNSERSSSVGKFSIERIHLKVPLHLLHTRKVSQLEGKVQFFEGQVDPLHSENSSLNEQLIVLTKMVSSKMVSMQAAPTFFATSSPISTPPANSNSSLPPSPKFQKWLSRIGWSCKPNSFKMQNRSKFLLNKERIGINSSIRNTNFGRPRSDS